MNRLKKNKSMSDVFTARVSGRNEDGDLLVRRLKDDGKEDRREWTAIENKRIKPALLPGDEVIVKTLPHAPEATVKVISRTVQADVPVSKIYGIVQQNGNGNLLLPTERNSRQIYVIEDCAGAVDGDFVSAEVKDGARVKTVKILKNHGPFNLHKATDFLILEKYDLPHSFNEKIAAELTALTEPETKKRTDLTAVPFVTIDGDDSKDFDDAVWAEPTPAGFRLMVAIADVAFYVREGSELDREAYRRGNSVYLPNMVIPMLPEKLSNELCSLQPGRRRAALTAVMDIDREGNLLGYEFRRGMIKSAARLTYQEVEDALQGRKSPNIRTVFKSTVEPVFAAYQALAKARQKRGALELEVPELKIKTGRDGEVLSISEEKVLTSNKIVEEFMIAANVAAALRLKKTKLPVMYRVHDRPPAEKMSDIKPLLESLKMKLPDTPALKPQHFNKIMAKCAKPGVFSGIGDLILRLQSQAQYSPHNIGHFGLGLKDYVHFTSPIRRYADLLIHRALIAAEDMPEGGGLNRETATMGAWEDIGTHLGETERRAVSAERDMSSRLAASYLVPAIGQAMSGKISGVSAAGLFVRLDDTGAEGLIPLSSMPDDYYELGCANLEVVAVHAKRRWRLGDAVQVRLLEASAFNCGIVLKYISPEDGEDYSEKGRRGSMSFRSAQPEKRQLKKSARMMKKKSRRERKKAIKQANKKAKQICGE